SYPAPPESEKLPTFKIPFVTCSVAPTPLSVSWELFSVPPEIVSVPPLLIVVIPETLRILPAERVCEVPSNWPGPTPALAKELAPEVQTSGSNQRSTRLLPWSGTYTSPVAATTGDRGVVNCPEPLPLAPKEVS